ncbi:MAG: hypothetical protein HYX78_05470 [Armatimonadetes bacterium]|nr:hypothetical protein [Armatimonadota bacterium]
MKPNVIVSGYMVRYPLGGMLWTHLQFLSGIRRLGYDVYFFEDAGWPNACYNPATNTQSDDPSYGTGLLGRIMRRYGLAGRWVYRDYSGHLHGMDADEVRRVTSSDFVLLGLSPLSWFDEFERAICRISLDEDPGFAQFKLAQGDSYWKETLSRYDVHFTYGWNIGKEGCIIPTAGIDWRYTNPPIVLDYWPVGPPPDLDRPRFTTIMSWSSYSSVSYKGEVYGQKDVEFVKFADLPSLVDVDFEIALGGAEQAGGIPERHGWSIANPLLVTRSLDSHRDYVRGSTGEFSVAKNCYVKSRGGWFSERSASYLACGRPVVIQDTGFTDRMETGLGIVPFSTVEEAAQGARSVVSDYALHSRRARELAEEHFDSRLVLGGILKEAGL